MSSFLTVFKEEIKNQIYKNGWIARQLKGLPAGIDIAYDILNRMDFASLKVIFDCGAHHGETALEFRKKFPLSQIYSFEPVKSNFEVLKNKVKMYPQIHCCHSALGNKEEIITIQLQLDSQTHSLNNRSLFAEELNSETVNVITIDSFLASSLASSIHTIDLLKIDTEGYEVQVLQGAQKSLADGRINFILAEATFLDDDKSHTNIKSINDYLKDYKYQIVAMYDQVIWRNPSRLSYFNVLFSRQ